MLPRQFLNSAIAEEVQNWYEETLINSELRDTLIARYPVSSAKGKIIATLISLGAVMVGLGSLLFIAAHWSAISVPWKLSLILFSIVISNAAGWWFQFKTGSRPRLGAAMFLLGSFFYGSGIWLVSQIFNISGDFPQGMFLWSIGTVATTVATGSSALCIMSTLLIGLWTLATAGQSEFSISTQTVMCFLLGTAVSLALSYRLRSPLSLSITLVSASAWIAFNSRLNEFGILVWGICLLNLYLLHRKKWQLLAPPFQYIGVVLALGSSLALTCDRYTPPLELSLIANVFKVTLSLITWATSLAVCTSDQAMTKEAIFAVLMASSVLILGHLSEGLMRVFLSNSIFLALTICLLYVGIHKLRNAWLVNTTMVFLGIYILCRYFDTFFSIMDRSFFFLLGGTLLMIIGTIAERKRREFLEGLRA